MDDARWTLARSTSPLTLPSLRYAPKRGLLWRYGMLRDLPKGEGEWRKVVSKVGLSPCPYVCNVVKYDAKGDQPVAPTADDDDSD